MGDDTLDRFSEACGQYGPLRVLLQEAGSEGISTHEFRQPFFLIGRDPSATLPIDHPEISRRHAYFQVVAGRVFCLDLASRTGVRWSGVSKPLGWVDPSQGVEVGQTRVRFRAEGDWLAGETGNLPTSRSFEWSPLPEARLEFVGTEFGREPWQVSRAMTLLGRSSTCRVQLFNPGVGKIHAALIRTPVGIWIVDLHGPGGLQVGGVPMPSARLEDGDEIALGEERLRIRIGASAVRVPVRSDLARITTRGEVRSASSVAGPPALKPVGSDEARNLPELAHADESMTTRLLGEFDRMHQRSTDQLQQAILMMFQMHQDQMEVIHHELSRIDHLEDELETLRSHLDSGKRPEPPRLTLRLVSGETTAPPSLEGLKSGRSRPGPAEFPDWNDSGALDVANRRPVEAPLAPPSHRADGATKRPTTDIDPHVRIARRIAEIRNERQGLWNRILGSIRGDQADPPTP